ncbi:MAG: pantoate--beta-alanine ligase [Paludibacter sp.]
MQIFKTIQEVKNYCAELKSKHKRIGFVPTMGALHNGHLQLVKRSVSENDCTIVSIFVNPTQFNNACDLEKYPRNPEADAVLLAGVGCNAIFLPAVDEMYNEQEQINTFEFDFEGLDKVMEGKFRPGHFNGVVQVVSKLFTITTPDNAYFGEKDFQQLAIIHLMTQRMQFNVHIVDCPIVREESGLAMSSRNERLTTAQRLTAANISRILFESQKVAETSQPDNVKSFVETELNKIEGLKLEYFEITDAVTLQTIDNWDRPSVGCIAVFCGDVRLIDNVRYN